MLADDTAFLQLQATPQGNGASELYFSKAQRSPGKSGARVAGVTMDEHAALMTPFGTGGSVPRADEGIDVEHEMSAPLYQHLLQVIDTLRTERHQREDVFVQRIQRLESELFERHQEGETQRLQLQEQQECSHRLQKENTVLCSQITELREQLAAVGDLCRRRGKALHDAEITFPGESATALEHPSKSTGPSSKPTASFSIRSIVMAPSVRNSSAACAPTLTSLPGWPAQQQQQQREDMLNRSAKSDGPSFDYNDLIPVTKDELDPELLAALHPPEASTVSHVLALSEEVQVLRQQLDAQRAAYEQERSRRLMEERTQHRRVAEEREQWTAALRRLEERNECCLRELVEYQRTHGPKLAKAEEEIVALKRVLVEALDRAEKALKNRSQTVARAESAASQKYKQRLGELRRSITLRTQQWHEEKEHLIRFVEEKQLKVEELETELKLTKGKLRKEMARSQLGKHGAESELQLMRQSLRQLEKKVYYAKAREEAAAPEDLAISKYYLA